MAKSCVEKCKRSKQNREWLYSDAFLGAYLGLAPSTVLLRYKRAFEVPYDNLVEIIDYIEFVLDKEPEKTNLHLAAGLVYEEIKDFKLMKKHFSFFWENTKSNDRKIKLLLIAKMKNADCGVICNNECLCCKNETAV